MYLFNTFFYSCRKTFLPILALISFVGYAQQDTLQDLAQTKGPEKLTKLEIWCNQQLYFRKPSRKIELLDKLEQIALKKNDEVILASITFYRGLYVIAMDGQEHKKGVVLMQKAISMAEKKGQSLQTAYFRHSLGYYYFNHAKDPVEALQNMLQAHYIFEEAGYQNIYDQSAKLDHLAYVYYHLNNFNESIKYLKISLKNPIENSRRHISILNTIGQNYRELVEPDNARKYFELSRQQAIIAKDTAWIGITAGNIGHLYLNEKLYSQAKPYMQEYYKCGLVVKDTALVIEALTGLGDIALHSDKADLALQQLQQAETLFNQAFKSPDMQAQNYVRKQYLLNVLAKVWDARGNDSRALDYLKESYSIKDSIERRVKLSKNTSIMQMFEAEQNNNRLRLLNEEKQTAEMKQKLYISLGILLAIIIILLYSRQVRERKIQSQKETLLKLEKEKTENELKSSREQLKEYIHHLQQKAELIEKMQSEMHLMTKQYDISANDEQAVSVLNKLSFATILTEDDWTRFKVLFEKVHSGFFFKLKTAYPGLTPAETRLCTLIKLEFSSHQMAAMMGISTMSIKKNRQRLRKKINLPKEQKLENLFLDF
ncbi:tetratricopeptide repeat protein [Flavobacterium mesophilum]|uniref:tetratricopeptide repeat protein n=1 Tax=Flavobacterium mesophilum TaxID=3143495 RepID=UPI0031CF3347